MSEYRSKAAEPSEPLLTVTAITTLATAVLALVVAFGLPINDQQQNTILGVLAAAGPIVVGVWGRRRVFSPATVERLTRRP